MTEETAYARFVRSSFEDQLIMLREPDFEVELRRELGDPAYEELRQQAGLLGAGPVLGGATTNVIVVPGIMGSVLVSTGLGGVWWIDAPRELNRLNGLALNVDGTGDADPNAKVSATTVDAVYFAFLTALSRREDLGHVIYPYDWRKSITTAADGLAELVTATYQTNGGVRVHLAGHSMGGLVIRAALMQHDDLWQKIGKIAFMATPHYGSPAIAGYLKNHFWGINLFRLLGKYLSRSTFRSMRGNLELLPAPAGVYPGTRVEDGASGLAAEHPCANFDLYDAGAYRLDLGPDEPAQLQAGLTAAADLHQALYAWHRTLAQERRERMLMIAGVGYQTLFRLAYKSFLGFEWNKMDRITRRKPGFRDWDGDGRVPLAAAELEDVQIRYVKGEHANLPSIPAVWEDVFAWFTTGKAGLRLPITSAAALSVHLGAETTSATPTLTGVPATAAGDDPGYLDFEPVPDDELDALAAGLAAGQLPEFNRLHLL